jgi:hypothetical protein
MMQLFKHVSSRSNVLHRPMKTEIEDDFALMAFSVCFMVKLYENNRHYMCVIKCVSSVFLLFNIDYREVNLLNQIDKLSAI